MKYIIRCDNCQHYLRPEAANVLLVGFENGEGLSGCTVNQKNRIKINNSPRCAITGCAPTWLAFWLWPCKAMRRASTF